MQHYTPIHLLEDTHQLLAIGLEDLPNPTPHQLLVRYSGCFPLCWVCQSRHHSENVYPALILLYQTDTLSYYHMWGSHFKSHVTSMSVLKFITLLSLYLLNLCRASWFLSFSNTYWITYNFPLSLRDGLKPRLLTSKTKSYLQFLRHYYPHLKKKKSRLLFKCVIDKNIFYYSCTYASLTSHIIQLKPMVVTKITNDCRVF